VYVRISQRGVVASVAGLGKSTTAPDCRFSTMGCPRPAAPLRAIDLFCGAGGIVLGLGAAGYETALAVDHWRPAIATLEANFEGMRVLEADLADVGASELLRHARVDGPPDVLAGGPPCQGFSSAGARRSGDARNTLVSRFAQLVAEIRPRAFVFENVEGLLTADGGSRVTELLDPVIEAGYGVHLRKVNAANFGVPQLRKRVIGIGTLGGVPPFPKATHFAFGAPGANLLRHPGMAKARTVADALRDLPAPGSTPTPSDHDLRVPGPADHLRIAALAQGQTMRDLPDHLQHSSYRRRAFRRVLDGTPTERRGGAPAGLRRLVAGEPSKAITSAAPRELVHPTADRPLTLRECARLQTFPDWFEFQGSQSERAVLLGNAVPPELVLAIGRSVGKWLAAQSTATRCKGGLVTFEPTLSSGRSPALAAISDLVKRRYGSFSTPIEETLWV
jgi:DNA (cytosine-5)-methyltransferase 1